MKVNNKGIQLIKTFEGCLLNAYLCPAKKWTIGYGNTRYANGKLVQKGDKITQQQAEVLLFNIVNEFSVEVSKLITVELNDNQFSAVVSFAFNLGINCLRKSSLLKVINEDKNSSDVDLWFRAYNKAGGKVLSGLTRRRKAESDLYFTA